MDYCTLPGGENVILQALKIARVLFLVDNLSGTNSSRTNIIFCELSFKAISDLK